LSAARRAAAYRGLIAEPTLEALAADPAAIDEFCSLSVAVERVAISDASLATACADGDHSVASVARVLLAIRATLRGASAVRDPSESVEASRIALDVSASSFGEAIELLIGAGCHVIEAPRAVVTAVGLDDPPAIRVLRAAASSDDRSLVEALAGEFDVAELKAAERLAGQRSLRAALPTAGAAFRGIGSRERAVRWSDRIEEVRRSGRKRRGALTAAVEATGVADAETATHAAAADAVWDSLEEPPSFGVRAALLRDAVSAARVSDGALRLLPIGS